MRAESRKNYYETLNKALRELYGITTGNGRTRRSAPTTLEWDDDGFEFDDGIFEEAARELLNAGGYSPEMLSDNEACRNLIKETFRVLDSGVSKGLGTKPDPDLAAALRENVFVFSGFKTHAELEQAAQLITDEKGVLKPFNQFLNDAKTINAEYNHNYLRSEYNQAVQSAQIAAKWHDVQSRKNLVNLQYRTANDERVRAEHRRLHGVTLPVDDPFWKQFTPPLGWNCRCTIVEVLKDDYPESDSQGSIATATQITDKPKDKIFRFNPGIEKAVFPKRHPYFPKGCGECEKTLLAYNPNSIWCKACSFIRKVLKQEQCKDKIKKDKQDAEYTLLHDSTTLNKIKSIEARTILNVNNNPLQNNGATIKVITDGRCLDHTIKSMFSDPDFILKNEDLKQFDATLFHNAVSVQWAICDTSHNGQTTERLKNKIDYFFYFKSYLSNGSEVYLHIAHFKPEYGGKYELYHISRSI